MAGLRPILSGMAMWIHAVMFAALVLFTARTALADAPKTLEVLDFDSEDAEDQAEALTQALRNKVRASQGYALQESKQSLTTLIMQRCGGPTGAGLAAPTPDCRERIARHLKVDRFIWGTMSKRPGALVTAEVHLWQKGVDNSTTETYSDNLKSEGDTKLLEIASRIFGKLTGTGTTASVMVRAGTGGGTVLVDGVEKAALVNGAGRVDAPPGQHTIEVRVPGFKAPPRTVMMAIGGDQEVKFELTPTTDGGGDGVTLSTSSLSGRKIAGYITIGVGIIFAAATTYEAIQWNNSAKKLNDDQAAGAFPHDGLTDAYCSTNAANLDCKALSDGRTARVLTFVFGAAGVLAIGAGVIILSSESSEPNKPAAARLELVPSLSPTGGRLGLVGTF